MDNAGLPPVATATESLWTVDDVMAYLAASDTTVYRMVAAGELPVHRLRGRLRFVPAEVRGAVVGGSEASLLSASGSPTMED